MTEAEILAQIDDYLALTGWVVRKFSQDHATRKQLEGWPDRVAIRDDVTLYIEAKSATGKRRQSQLEFAQAIAPHCGPHVRYIVVRRLEDVINA